MSDAEILARWMVNAAANYGALTWGKMTVEGRKRTRKVAARLLDNPPPVLLKALKEKAK
jgi:hypothetical protein